MKKLLLIVTAILCQAAFAAQQTRSFKDNGKVLVNPMMGWFHEFYTDSAALCYPVDSCDEVQKLYPGMSAVYLRVPWSALEPSEGRYNWTLIDSTAQQWRQRGIKLGLRIITSGTGELRYATPQWVEKAGAKAHPVTMRKGALETMEFEQDDPIFLEKLENFLKAVAARFDGNPDVAFIDVAFGTWGEGHTVHSLKLSQEENIRQALVHARLYRKLFPHTLLCMSEDIIGPFEPGDDFPAMQELRKMGIAMRDDSILCLPKQPSFHGGLAQHFWPLTPVFVEHQHYALSQRSKAWDNAELLRQVELYHVSYLSINGWPDDEAEGLGEWRHRIDMRLGYRIMPEKISFPDAISYDQDFQLTAKLSNRGVAPCYPGGFPCYTLKHRDGRIMAVFVDEQFDVRDLTVAAPGKAKAKTSTLTTALSSFGKRLPGGEYSLYFSIGRADGTPVLALPMDKDDGTHRYFVGKIKVNSKLADSYAFPSYWIWNSENPGKTGAITYLTRVFDVPGKAESATLWITADDKGEVWLNGQSLTVLGGWNNGQRLDITHLVKPGKNLLAVKGVNATSFCGVVAGLEVRSGNTLLQFASDSQWRASAQEQPNWNASPDVSARWPKASELFLNGKGPWGHGVRFFFK